MTKIANQILEQSTTTGTGNFSIARKQGFRRFSDEFNTGSNNLFWYFIRNKEVSVEEYEVGEGYLLNSSTLVRANVIESSNSNSNVDFQAGEKEVINDIPADLQLNHNELDNVSSGAHHQRYQDSEAESAINNDGDHGSTAPHNYFSGDHQDLSNINVNDHHTRYTNSEAESAINNDSDHGSTASHNYFSGDHSKLNNVTSGQHHSRYTDSEAESAINNDGDHGSTAQHDYVDSHTNLTNVNASQHHSKTVQRVDGSIPNIIEGTSGNRPSAGTEGRIYYQTDTQEIYYDDGNSWGLQADVSGGGGGSGIWTLDGEFNVTTNTQQPTYSLNSTYDMVRVTGKIFIDGTTGNNPGFDLSFRVNGVSQNTYKGLYHNGATSEDSAFRMYDGDDRQNNNLGLIDILLTGRWGGAQNDYWEATQNTYSYPNSSNRINWFDKNQNISSPLNSITFLDNRNQHKLQTELNVYGRDY